jgi:nitrite reductase (NADH) small subunit
MAKLVTVASCDALAPGDCRRVQIEDKEIALFRIDDTFYAIDNECPHYGAPLCDGWVDDHVVTCPWHAWQFDVTDGRCLTVPDYDVPTYVVKVEDGVVQIEIEE